MARITHGGGLEAVACASASYRSCLKSWRLPFLEGALVQAGGDGAVGVRALVIWVRVELGEVAQGDCSRILARRRVFALRLDLHSGRGSGGARRREEKKQAAQRRKAGATEAGELWQSAAKARARGRARGGEGACKRLMKWAVEVEELWESCTRSSVARSGRKQRRKGR